MRKVFKTCVAFACALVMSVGYFPANAEESIAELQQDKKEQESKKEQAEAVVAQLQTEQDNILAAIADLDAQVADYNVQIADLEIQHEQLETQIEDTKQELLEAQATEQEQYEAMKLHIQYSYEHGDVGYFDTVFSSADMTEIVNKAEYSEQIYNYDSNQLMELVKIRQTIANTQVKLETDLEAVQEVEDTLAENKEAVEILIEGKQEQAIAYETSIDEYEAQIAAIQADIAATEAAIAEAERREQERIAAAAAAAAEKARQEALAAGQSQEQADAAANQASTQATQATIYYTGGTLQWPVSSGGHIGSGFGPRVSPGGIGSTNHKGVDIGCATGTPIVACEAGTVIAAGYSSSMGNYVTISHGNGVSTTYMHNTSLAVSVGQVVSRAQVIAYAGSTGNSTGPHCHLGLSINGTWVDPAPYLQ